jgi:hypothetical protein
MSSDDESASKSVLHKRLCYALTFHPSLLQDFVSMCDCIDKREYINVQGISNDSMRLVLADIFDDLPVLVYIPSMGYAKKQDVNTPIQDVLFKRLPSKNLVVPLLDIKPSSYKSSSQDNSTRKIAPMHCIQLLSDFPALRDEILDLLDRLLDGDCIDIADMANEGISSKLKKIFYALDCVYTPKEGYGIPQHPKDIRKQVKKQVNLLYDFLYLALKENKHRAKKFKKEEKKKKKEKKRKKSKSKKNKKKDKEQDSGSESSDESDSDEEDDDDKKTTSVSATAMRSEMQPTVPSIDKSMATFTTGHSSKDTDGDDSDKEETTQQPPSTEFVGSFESTADGLQREEWMSIGWEQSGPKVGGTTMTAFGSDETIVVPTARKFSSGRGAIKEARNSVAEKRKNQEVSKEEKEAMAALEAYKAQRGPSLMELHQQQKKKAKTGGNTEGNGKGGKDKGITIGEERTGFDYKRDMVDFRSSMQGSAAQKMVDEAKQLDSRFTKRILKK